MSFRNRWMAMPIEQKMRFFVGMMMCVLVMAAFYNVFAINYSVSGISEVLSDTTRCENAQAAMVEEVKAFKECLRTESPELQKEYNSICLNTQTQINALPYDEELMGDDRYARTRNIKNAYAEYTIYRDKIMNSTADGADSVRDLYKVYDMQTYIQGYIRMLSQVTVQQGSTAFERKYPVMHSMPYILILLAIVIILSTISFGRFFTASLMEPVSKMASEVRRITAGDYSGEDIEVANNDELGELVEAFNSMKHATENNIQTLQENQELSERLHKEEIMHADIEKRLNSTRLNLLQSQIKPHFLFNTLNSISGMAELENAEVTDKMIRSLSAIFRYNLHTVDQIVSLTNELKVANDYLYLQKMRFGDRLNYEIELNGINTDNIMVPVFLLQPLIENAVSHGVAAKESGGCVKLSVRLEEAELHIVIKDTGAGMSKEVYDNLIRELEEGVEPHENTDCAVKNAEDGKQHHVGIGVGNVYRRIHSIYRKGEMFIRTKEGEGTEVELVLPQDVKIVC